MTTEATKTRRFRPWVWAAVLPGLFALSSVFAGSPGAVISWMLLTGVVVLLAWRGRRTPWWAVLGWVLAAWGGLVVVIFSTGDEPTPVAAILMLALGAALGIAGLIVNAMKSQAPQSSAVDPG